LHHHQDQLLQATEGGSPREQQRKMGVHFWLNIFQMKSMHRMVLYDVTILDVRIIIGKKYVFGR
jgi:hypothetical protein